MKFRFNVDDGLIVVRAELSGPTGDAILRLALDTGATSTLINTGMLVSIGYDPSLAPDRHQITTGSGIEFVPQITLSRLTALGKGMIGFPILCHTLPQSAGIDGLLGLDFFREWLLTIDFRQGAITLS